MLHYGIILYLALLHRVVICSNVTETILSSQDQLWVEESIANENIWENFTEQFIRDKDESNFSSNNTTAPSDRNTENELWDGDQFLEVWNPIVISRIWKNETYRDANISLSCGEDLTRYMMGVSRKNNWALKMMDADGKYTWGAFSANKYWFGDLNQCRKMENEFMEWQKDERVQRSKELPPFRVSVNSINLMFEILKPGLNETYNVTLGLCMPIVCDTKDIERLLYFVQNQSSISLPSRITINYIRNLSKDVRNPKVVPKPLSEALLSFSLLVNISKLCSLNVGEDTLAPIHGLKFYTMLWIILVHTCLLANAVSDSNMFRSIAENDFFYQPIGNGTYSVDTFFFISGCLVTFLYYRTMANKRIQEKTIIKGCHGQVVQFLAMMWYRYFRLTPVYLLVIGLIQVSMKWYHDHSMMELTALDYKTCEKFWWRNALYINTYFDMDDRCITWSWYLANDTQFYTMGIIILIIGASFLPAAAFMGAFFLIASWVTTAIITLNTKHVPSIQEPFAHYENLYDKPWTRIGPYLIGMATGWYLFKIDCKANMNKAVVAIGWSISLLTMTSIVYGLYGTSFGPILSALYTALSHSGWAICLAWILIACVSGYGGIVTHLLSWKYLYPISRLTYCVYLVHPALLRAMILHTESSWHLSHGFVVISLLL
ncbi:nose resistant to fluoxetine protein 6-like [Formica exsecta]|uniref:nose resistant to fluoxetine protein 6-like n=1 Tax=Formica exsecta TaxID=72781 RepID=UPI001142FF48|nr:nose resistant to fluoxetine protein 6-like [Formica exsecta]